MSVGLGTAVGYLDLDISGFAKGIDGAISGMDNLDTRIKTASQGFQTIGGMITKAGTALTAGFTAPIIGATSASVKFGTEFDEQMSNVKAVTGATADEFESLREAAISWGEKTVFTATEAGEALYYMGLAGWDSEEAIAALGSILNLAAAGNLDLGRTSDIVTDALTAFGLEAQDATSFTNVLAAAMSNSNTDVNMMGESFKYVAPVAGSLGYSINDIAIALGLFANNGIKSSQAGTGLRQAFNALINPSDKAVQVMDRYGVSLFNADGSAKDFMTVMQELRGTFSYTQVDIAGMADRVEQLTQGLEEGADETDIAKIIFEEYGESIPINDMEKLTALTQMFGVRALPGMLAVINASEEDFDGLTNKIYNADQAFVKFGGQVYTMDEALEEFGDRVYTDKAFEILGASAAMAAIQIANLGGDWKLFTSALGTAMILISDMVKGTLGDLLRSLTELINTFNRMEPEQREQIAQWALIVASIGPVLLIFGKLITGIVSLVNSFKVLKSAFKVVTPAILRFANDISGFISLVGEEGLMSTLSGLTGVSSTVIATITAVIAIVLVLIAAFVKLWKSNEDFRNRIIQIWDEVKAKFEEAGQRLVEIFNELGFSFEDFSQLMSSAIGALKALWNGFCEILAPIFIKYIAIIGDVIKGFVDLFVGVLEVFVGIVKGFRDGDWSMAWKGVSDIVKAVVETILNVLDHFLESCYNIAGIIAKWLGLDWVKSWDEAKQATFDWFNSIIQCITQLPTKISSFFSNNEANIRKFISTVGELILSIPGRLGSIVTIIGNTVRNFVSNVISSFSQLSPKILAFLMDTLNKTTQWSISMVLKAFEMGKDFVGNISTFFSELPNKIAYWTGYILATIIKWVVDMVFNAREMAQNFVQNIVFFFLELPLKVLNYTSSAFDVVRQWSNNMVNKAREMAQNFLNNIISFFVQIPGKINGYITSAWENVKQWANNMVNKSREMAQNFLNNIISYFSQLPGKVHNYITSVWDNVKQWATNMVNKARELGQNFLNNIVSFFSQLPGKINSYITSAYNYTKQWALDMPNKAREMGQNFLNNVNSFFTQLPGKIQSFLNSAYNNTKQWSSNMISKAREMAQGFMNNITSSLSNLPGKLQSVLNTSISSVTRWASDMRSKASEAAQGFMNGVTGGLSGLPTKMQEIGSNIVTGIWNGISSGWGWLERKVNSLAQSLLQGAKDALDIDSPSGKFRDEVGRWIPLGIGEGFSETMPTLMKLMQRELSDSASDLSMDVEPIGLTADDFIQKYAEAFETIVVWFETLEERMAIAVDKLMEYFEYLIYTKQILDNDESFRSLVLGANNRSNRLVSVSTPITPTSSGSGDTFNFYSPKAIDEVQAARMLRNTKRDLAEGF